MSEESSSPWRSCSSRAAIIPRQRNTKRFLASGRINRLDPLPTLRLPRWFAAIWKISVSTACRRAAVNDSDLARSFAPFRPWSVRVRAVSVQRWLPGEGSRAVAPRQRTVAGCLPAGASLGCGRTATWVSRSPEPAAHSRKSANVGSWAHRSGAIFGRIWVYKTVTAALGEDRGAAQSHGGHRREASPGRRSDRRQPTPAIHRCWHGSEPGPARPSGLGPGRACGQQNPRRRCRPGLRFPHNSRRARGRIEAHLASAGSARACFRGKG